MPTCSMESDFADTDEMRFSASEYNALMNLMMASDPWPTTEIQKRTITDLLNEEANRRNYDDWIEAYHAFNGNL